MKTNGILRELNKSIEAAQYLLTESKILYIEPNKKRTQAWLAATGLEMPGPSDNVGVLGHIKPQKLQKFNTNVHDSEKDARTSTAPDSKNSLRIAEGSTSPVSAQERAAFSPAGSVVASQPEAERSPLATRNLHASGEGKETAGGLAEEAAQ